MASNSDRHKAAEILLQAAELDAETCGGNILEVAYETLAAARAAKKWRSLTPYQRGHHHGYNGQESAEANERESDVEQYLEGYSEGGNDAALALEDGRIEQIERDFLDGECTLSGHYFHDSEL